LRHYLLLLCLLLCLTIPLHAQDDPTPYDIALQRIQEAAASGATQLDLSRLGLTELPPELWQLHKLRVLGLWSNQLTSLPAEIGQLSNLQILNLSYNQLTSLPPEIGQLTNLEWFHVDGNQLTSLPPEIGQLTNLRVLNLAGNQIHHLPTRMGNLNHLSCTEPINCYFNLDNNPLISPPPEIVEQGTAAVLAYLRNQAWYHIQRLIIGAASGVGLLAALILGVRYRQHRRKPKAKRGLT
jgi:internalin A